MKFYLDPRQGKDKKHSIVIRGRDHAGKQYRIFLTSVFKEARIEKGNWRQAKQKPRDQVRGNPTLGYTLEKIKTKLESHVFEKQLQAPTYGIPEAWRDLFEPVEEDSEDKFPEKVIAAIPFYKTYFKGKKSHGYLRILDQVEADIRGWNADVRFSNLSFLTLESFRSYLSGNDKDQRRLTERRINRRGKPIKLTVLASATVYARFKYLRELATLAERHGVNVDKSVFDFTVKYAHHSGGFALTYSELMKIFHYQSDNKTRMVVRDYFLIEAFTGIRNSDCQELRNGNIHPEYIQYFDRKNQNKVKTVTRHKLNNAIIRRYYRQANPSAYLMPRLAQATVNGELKFIARELKLDRLIPYNGELQPIYRHLSTHDGRHSYATLLNGLGVPADYVKDELGHSQGLTFGTYVHRNDRYQLIAEAVNTLPIELTNETQIRNLRKVV